jgi:hypothetical protein
MMNPTAQFAFGEGFSGEAERRKRLGQYFTGVGLGRLLGALADAGKATSIIDPMAGTGDLLAACLELGATPDAIGAIDIDPLALSACMDRVPTAVSLLGSAFDSKVLSQLPRLQWDLVIANPPYVRYQSIAKRAGKGFPLPSAIEIRNGLLASINMLPALDEEDRSLFRKLVHGYSGLADLAVPSWILCAALVAPGGRMALVVPESWLSRDYAAVVHYLLLRWFKVEFIVEDEHAAWFSDTQIKTTLLVARRILRRDTPFEFPDGAAFTRIALSGRAQGPDSPIARLRPHVKNAEARFAQEAREWLVTSQSHEEDMVRATSIPLKRVAANLRVVCARQKWFTAIGDAESRNQAVLPHELASWLSKSGAIHPPMPLSAFGVSIGQGLRTGANAFFYAECLSEDNGFCELKFAPLLEGKTVRVPKNLVFPVVRRQVDLPEGLTVKASSLSYRVLDLRRVALPEDIEPFGAAVCSYYEPMPEGLAQLVRLANKTNFGDADEHRFVWELSAVAPNIRRRNPSENSPPRFWYMLPDFALRHQPDIMMARVNNAEPKAFLNKDKAALVDANFSTLWTEANSLLDACSLLALLNSTWCRAVLELSASVMGGGALKIEAAHLRRMPVPMLDEQNREKLSILGKTIAESGNSLDITDTMMEIDNLIASALLGRPVRNSEQEALCALAEVGRKKRKNHKNKGCMKP